MKLNFTHIFSLILFILLFSFCKQEDESGNGLGDYTGPYVEEPPQTEFTLEGQLKYCNGENVGLRQITLYESENLNILYDGETDEQGNFKVVFAGNRPAGLSGHEISAPNILSIIEDSTDFVLPGLTDLDDLELVMGDSFEVDVYLRFFGDSLTNLDTIFYDFVRLEYAFQNLGILFPSVNTIYGPITQDTILKRIKHRWNIIEVDELGQINHKIFWARKTPHSSSSPNYFKSESTKLPCNSGVDIVEIGWN